MRTEWNRFFPLVDAGEKQAVNSGCEFELLATPDVSGGDYTWIVYDCPGAPDTEGDTVGTTRRTLLNASYTTIYQVFLKLDNGCYSSDFVEIEVGEGECARTLLAQNTDSAIKPELHNCVPNPATSTTTFVYTMPKGIAGEIRLTNLLGQTMGIYNLAPESGSLEVNCSEYNNGIYFYSLIVDGKNVQTKRLAITR